MGRRWGPRGDSVPTLPRPLCTSEESCILFSHVPLAGVSRWSNKSLTRPPKCNVSVEGLDILRDDLANVVTLGSPPSNPTMSTIHWEEGEESKSGMLFLKQCARLFALGKHLNYELGLC